MRFRGREMAHKDLGWEKLKKIIEVVADLSKVEQEPKFEGKMLFGILTPTGKPVTKKTKKAQGDKDAKVKNEPRSPETV